MDTKETEDFPEALDEDLMKRTFEAALQDDLASRCKIYHPEADGGISILDDSLGIDWKIPTDHAILSEKDTKHDLLKDFDSPFDINVDLYK